MDRCQFVLEGESKTSANHHQGGRMVNYGQSVGEFFLWMLVVIAIGIYIAYKE